MSNLPSLDLSTVPASFKDSGTHLHFISNNTVKYDNSVMDIFNIELTRDIPPIKETGNVNNSKRSTNGKKSKKNRCFPFLIRKSNKIKFQQDFQKDCEHRQKEQKLTY